MNDWQAVEPLDAVEEHKAAREAVEPWKPQVGDRVAIWPSPECKHVYDRGKSLYDGQVSSVEVVGHQPFEYGATGTVSEVKAGWMDHGPTAHDYIVLWSRPQVAGPGLIISGKAYAAYELVPLDSFDAYRRALPNGNNARYERP